MRNRTARQGIVMALAIAIPAVLEAQERPAYRDASLPVAHRVRDLLGRMTLDEKFWQLYMIPGAPWDSAHDYSNGVFGLQNRSATDARSDAALQNRMQRYFVDSTRLGIPTIPFEEGVHGLMRREAMVFPQAIALAATFDSALVGRVASAIARETRSRGIRQILSPVVNIANDVRWGRVEETYGEDPYLSSVLGRVFVREFERRGVIATPKHFVANVGEGGRDSYPIDVSTRLLEELHYPPFRATLLDAGARSVMTSYNSVDGLPMSQHAGLLNGTLRRDWGFRGFVISDQAAVGGATVLHFTEASTATATQRALAAGLDVIFQSSWPQHRPYLDALRRGTVPVPVIDSAVSRVLRAKFELGLFEQPYVHPDSAAAASAASQRAITREAARAAVVLLRNERGSLPLSASTRTFAVIGADAQETRFGGYTLDDAHGVSFLAAMRQRFGDRVRYAPGPGRGPHRSDDAGSIPDLHAARTLVPVAAAHFDSLRGEYWANTALEGRPQLSRPERAVDFRWTISSPARGIPSDWYSARWVGGLTVPATGATRLAVEGNDGYRVWLDERLLIDNWKKVSYRTTSVAVALAPNSVHDLRMEYFESTGNARIRLLWDAGTRDDAGERIDSAVALAQRSDAAIVVAGIEEGEFRDRSSLALPGRQEELILRIAATGKPVVVILVGGSAITMSRWIDSVSSVLLAWYPGEQGGPALVDVLTGDANPAGRLPITFPMSEGQLPLTYHHKPTGRGDDYLDGSGMAAFPFGYGLSYTQFEYSALRVSADSLRTGDTVTVRFTVKNIGARRGSEVPQLYVRDILASVVRPVMELKGFTRIELAPGETREVVMQLPISALRFLDANMHWVVEPGVYRLLVGASSKDIRLRGAVTVVN
jgi:beta-glucosidase